VVVARIHVHVGRAIVVIAHGHEPWATTDVAILDVLLMRSGTRIEGDLDRLTAIRAVHLTDEIGDAVAERKLLIVERIAGLVGVAGVIGQIPLGSVMHVRTVKACA
jgi:hypothetical protein